MTNKDKSLKILNRIVELVNKGYRITFSDDFGGHSLTVGIEHEFDKEQSYQHFHTYGGQKNEQEMLDSLYSNLNYPVYNNEEITHPIKEY